MSTDFKCNDGNEHDFDSNTDYSEYCAKGCGEKWSIYTIIKLGADLKEKDAAVEQLKAENICKDLKITIQHDKITALKSENEKAYDALAGNICGYCWQKMEEEPTAKRTHQDHVNELLAEITALRADLKIVRETLEGQRAINDRQYAEKEQLKSKLKIAKETLINLKSWGYQTQWEIIDKAISEIGGEI